MLFFSHLNGSNAYNMHATWGFKLWCTGRDRNHNEVGVIINKQLLEDVVEVSRKGDRILIVKLI